MDLPDDEAQDLLETAIEIKDKKSVYNYSVRTRRVYEFYPSDPSAPTVFHGYPIPGVEAGNHVLRVLRRFGLIDQVLYERLGRQSTLD